MIRAGTSNDSTRDEWLRRSLARLPAGGRLLDAGAGERRFEDACRHLVYVAQDFAGYDGRGDSKGLQTGSWRQDRLDIVSDITAIPKPDASFDAILCTEVFEHLPRPLAALAEFSRLLRPGGELILTAPFVSATHFAPHHYYSGFNRYFFETHLPALGFDVVELTANGNYFEFLAQELRRLHVMAKTYAGARWGLLEKAVAVPALVLLEALSRRDRASADVLCFGFFVRAIRRQPDAPEAQRR